MNARTKKIIKWVLIVTGAIIVLLAATVSIYFALLYNSIYEPIPYVSRDGSYIMPEFPESDIELIDDESDYYEDDSEDDISYDDTSEGSTVSKGGSGGSLRPPKETPIYIVEPIDENILNILLVGFDVYEPYYGRSDSMMLLSYNKKTGEITLTSFLRDILVPIEGHGWNRLNSACRFGSVGLTINTINEVFQLDIQHYVSVDFTGFPKLIDSMGGVTVSITKEEATYVNNNYSWGVSAGNVKLNGEKALKFARIRHLSGGDFNRTERQRRILTAVINEMFSRKNPSESVSLVNQGLKNVKTNLSAGTIVSLVYDFMSKDYTGIDAGSVPSDKSTYSLARYNGMSIIKLNFDKNVVILHERIYGKE
ncbi:MAG: hypothetical protein CVU97_04455 [Firmicutes bacterium HGW-Firmicutes-21]|nr:MAG: hypothetical protein CVU97_04455 [Firmicutes bacterium HGW-Firmicutes-21]